ncbi:hypothetical protein WJX77_009287 [Trebouxia sp. C0004]
MLFQAEAKESETLFQRGVMNLDLSSAFGQLQHKLGDSASGLENVDAMAIDSACLECLLKSEAAVKSSSLRLVTGLGEP